MGPAETGSTFTVVHVPLDSLDRIVKQVGSMLFVTVPIISGNPIIRLHIKSNLFSSEGRNFPEGVIF